MLDPLPTSIHGVRVSLPAAWEDWSLLRFLAPQVASDDVDPAGSEPRFRANLLVSRHNVSPTTSLAHLFDEQNDLAKRQQPSFAVARGGVGTYLGQACGWQDVSFVDPMLKKQIFQRQIGFLPEPGEVVLFTVTADEPRLDELCQSFAFTV